MAAAAEAETKNSKISKAVKRAWRKRRAAAKQNGSSRKTNGAAHGRLEFGEELRIMQLIQGMLDQLPRPSRKAVWRHLDSVNRQ